MTNIQEALQILNEMSKSQSEIRQAIIDKEEQRLQNLVLIFIFRDWQTANHWSDELLAACSKTFKWNNTNKWMTEFKLRDMLISPWEDSFIETADAYVEEARIHEQKNSKNKIEVGNYSIQNLHDFIVEYNLWLANKLSINGKVTLEEVKEEINFFLNKYPRC